MSSPPYVSVVVPVFNEAGSVPQLVERVRDSLADRYTWELIIVDDGSTDATAKVASEHSERDFRVRLLRLARNFGQSEALQAGFDHARGRVLVSMDGDLQNDPADIPTVVDKLNEGFDLVAGYRAERRDPWLTRRVPSRIANAAIRWLTGVSIRDVGCSLRAYRRPLVERLTLYSDMHRYLPVLAASRKGVRVTELPVRHHERRFGVSKYGLGRTFRVLADLLTLTMIRRFRFRPLSLFTLGALFSVLVGLGFGVAAVFTNASGTGLGAEAFVFSGSSLLLFGLASYLVMVGLLGEVALTGEEYRRSVRDPGSPDG